ncbi:hypothetical protein PLEOSDRAFT_1099816 [Pleurotus ostreatus PC15]|uniref:Uncharacterized protein n=1 Tax=Pleurotus ostreatus (strain PC15) TaxID=1137138 RepID=A0A067PDD1_PLEO1|nr:hypothetical protein PLEOSDRAFT_1099816 [Pleurotus ostreatus PC15]
MNYNQFSGDFDGFIGDGPSASAYGQQFDPRLEYQLLELLPFLNEGQNVLDNSFYTGPDGGGAYDAQAYKFMPGGGMEQNATFNGQAGHEQASTLDELPDIPLSSFNPNPVDNDASESLLWGEEMGLMSGSVASVSLNDPEPIQARQPPSRSQLPLPDSTPNSEYNELRVDDQWTNPTSGRMAKGKARPQYYSPYARGERRHLVDQCTSAATWPHLPVPLPIVTSPNTPCGEATLQNELYEPAVTTGQLSPSKQPGESSEMASELPSPISPSFRTPQRVARTEEEKRAAKKRIDTDRAKALQATYTKFSALFPARSLLESKTTAVRVIKYIMNKRVAPVQPSAVELWWLQSGGDSALPQYIVPSTAAVEASIEDPKLRRKVARKQVDANRNKISTAVHDHIRSLFPTCKTLVQALTRAIDYLAYAKATGAAPEDDHALDVWLLARNGSAADIPSPFF